MTKLFGAGRTGGGLRRVKAAGAAGAIVVVSLVAFATPAFAHHPVLSGQSACVGDDHVITWSITNGGHLLPRPTMVITSVTGRTAARYYPVTGYTVQVASGATITAHSSIPGSVTGTVTLTVSGSWSDHITATRSTTVDLGAACGPKQTTTTTTTVDTPTTVAVDPTTTPTTVGPASATTEPTTPTTTHQVLGAATSPTTVAPPSTGPAASTGSSLPFTGSQDVLLACVGFGMLAAGSAIVLLRRRRTAGA